MPPTPLRQLNVRDWADEQRARAGKEYGRSGITQEPTAWELGGTTQPRTHIRTPFLLGESMLAPAIRMALNPSMLPFLQHSTSALAPSLEWQWLFGIPFIFTSLRMRGTFFERATSTCARTSVWVVCAFIVIIIIR